MSEIVWDPRAGLWNIYSDHFENDTILVLLLS